MTTWARAGSFHSAGSSDFALSSANCFSALSQSKMPPQQSDGLLHFFDQVDDLGAHGSGVRTGEENRKGSIESTGPRRQAAFDDRGVAAAIAHPDDHCVLGWAFTWLESLENDIGIAEGGALAGLRVDRNELDAGRHPERRRRLVAQRIAHEGGGDRRGQLAAG